MISGEEIREALEFEPWLQFFLAPDDYCMDDARVRFLLAQHRAIHELRARHETIERRVSVRGLLTTSFTSDRFEVER